MAKSSPAFLVFLCLSMLILSTPEVDAVAKVCIKVSTKTLSTNCQKNDCDCHFHSHACSEWEDGSHGNCKTYQIQIVCTCYVKCADTSSTSNAY
ncbi:hypothetical protein EUTSA_v10000393mg [Eutrema salsugineum]|uniref:Knottin scorpion toxin-like domain-containing protein n=1 Tax=Eutrema salsugineum TaxID=72664 RepID=V4L6T7_EUTSA|nr:putative defensin-like protein 12 [Eutrema salsugineum]ESQ46065.1 hypothetical protein EUTSA_v10000393mg [Eutrema salsugineum]